MPLSLIFLKLGGSLITEKSGRERARRTVIGRLAQEIHDALIAKPETRLLVGHGSGSFGHPAAARFGIIGGAHTGQEWHGFAEVWSAANRLHRIMLDALKDVGLSVLSFPPSALAVADRGEIAALPAEPIQRALEAGLLPLVQGDVAFDRSRGATILSTERVLTYLAAELRPSRILLAGIEEGVYRDYPARNHLLPELTQAMLPEVRLQASEATDVTGGMRHKVEEAFKLAHTDSQPEVRIFSGETAGNVQAALLGYALGTRIVPT